MATIDERLEALTQTVELLTADVRELRTTIENGFKHIHNTLESLVLIAKNHERRLDRLEEE